MHEAFHADIVAATRLLADRGIACPDLAIEPDNAEYGAAISDAAGLRFRVGKVTPRKVGMFVTVWRRATNGSTEPLPDADRVRSLIVTAREGDRFGFFAFPRSALRQHGITSVDGAGGKRGFRVYPPWSATANPQAKRSQAWQAEYFLELGTPAEIDAQRAQRLLAGP